MMTKRLALVLALSVAACGSPAPVTSGGHAGTGSGGATGGAGTGAAGAAPDGGAGAPSDAAPEVRPAGDPGRVTLHRLTRFEYDNTVKDLLGVTTSPAESLPGDDLVDGFDNHAEGLHITATRYLQVLDLAKALAEQTFGDATLRARIVTCAEDAGGTCARTVISAFGQRAWRRPLTAEEVQSAGAFYDAARADTGDFQAALQRVVAMMLSSMPFLYKVEIDPEPTSTTPHPLSGYELASRLSYLLWSSMPDDELLALAPSLRQPDVLAKQLDRMLDSPKSDRFARAFAGRWLGIEELASHHADSSVFARWNGLVGSSMTTELYRYFGEFRDRPMSGFFTSDVHFIDGRLGQIYQLNDIALDAPMTRVERPAHHAGFLGLAGFLTLTSLPDRTSPSTRGSWILERLLCQSPGEHPPEIMPKLNLSPTNNVRKSLTLSLLQPTCNHCHAGFDGVGFALEHYDAIGMFRNEYKPMDPVDATGTLGAATFDGAAQLGAVLAKDPRFAACAARKALTYALGRSLDDGDAARLADLTASWKQGSIRELLHAVVASDAFRLRRGEEP